MIDFSCIATKAMMAVFVLGALIILPVPASASGSYSRRPPQAPSSTQQAYELGKNIFNGKVQLTGQGDAMGQREELSRLQGELPGTTQQRVDLSQLAGDLSVRELEALKTFLKKRYKVQ